MYVSKSLVQLDKKCHHYIAIKRSQSGAFEQKSSLSLDFRRRTISISIVDTQKPLAFNCPSLFPSLRGFRQLCSTHSSDEQSRDNTPSDRYTYYRDVAEPSGRSFEAYPCAAFTSRSRRGDDAPVTRGPLKSGEYITCAPQCQG